MKPLSNAGLPRLFGFRFPVSGILLLVAACSLPIPPAQPDTTQYFILQEQAPPPAGAAPAKAVVIRLSLVDVPAYLADQPLAVRRGGNEIRYLDRARWAEPLDQDLARNIRRGLGVFPELVVRSRFDAAGKWDYDLKIRMGACEGTDDRKAQFTADWVLEPGPDSSLPRRSGTFAAKDLVWDGRTPESLVAALSRGVTQLCEALGAALTAP